MTDLYPCKLCGSEVTRNVMAPPYEYSCSEFYCAMNDEAVLLTEEQWQALMPPDWRPIEEAPRDGTPVLVFASRHGWEGMPRVVCAVFGGLGPEWAIYGCGPTSHSEQWLDVCTPTHWMPLPSPPKETT